MTKDPMSVRRGNIVAPLLAAYGHRFYALPRQPCRVGDT
jgi:hypothetical protein